MRSLRNRRALILLAAAGIAIFLLSGALVRGGVRTCPKCGAPLEAGAAFCTQCGSKVDEGAASAASAVSDPRRSLVQVVAAHDRELTSVVEAMVYGSTVRVDSLLGTAFAVAPGELVTDAALLLGAQSVTLRDSGGHSIPAKIVGVDPLIGVGLLKADLPGVPALMPREGGLPQEGEALTALGYSSSGSGGIAAIITSPGVVSGLHREGMGIHPVEDYLQTDASLPRGFAGGPGVDPEGHLLGMSTALPFGRRLVLGPMVGIALFIPVEWMDRALAWIRAGEPVRPWSGLHVVRANADDRRLFGLPPEVHWLVQDVFPGSPAASGLRRGDGILKIQGEEFSSLASVQARLLVMKVGDRWALEVYRSGKQLPVELVLGERPGRPRLTGPDALRVYGGLEIEMGTSPGLIISRVIPGTEASAAKLKPGDVLSSLFTKKDIQRVEKSDARWRGVKDLADLEEQIQRAYSDLDFALGLKFHCKDGEKRELFLYSPLTATNAL